VLKQAVWIQDIGRFRDMVIPVLQWYIGPYIYLGVTIESALEWIIKEEVWVMTQINILHHDSKQSPERDVYWRVKAAMHSPCLEQLMIALIRVPKVYGDQQIKIELKNRDLWIYYYINQPLTIPS
jgi:hypothetical protein